MAGKGLFRTMTPQSGAEYAVVDHGVVSSMGEMPRAQYEAQGYQPPFDELPTKELYEKSNANRT